MITKYQEAKSILTKDILIKLLLNNNKTYVEISKEYGICKRIVSKLAHENNISKNYSNISKNNSRRLKIDSHLLVNMYCVEKLSINCISKKIKCSAWAISKRIKELGIKIRSAYDVIYYENRRIYKNTFSSIRDRRSYQLIMEEYIGRKIKTQEHIHHRDFDRKNNSIDNLFIFENNRCHKLYHSYIARNGFISCEKYMKYYNDFLKDKLYKYEWLYNEYIIKNKSCNKISKELNVSRGVVTKNLKKFGIYDRRKPSTY